MSQTSFSLVCSRLVRRLWTSFVPQIITHTCLLRGNLLCGLFRRNKNIVSGKTLLLNLFFSTAQQQQRQRQWNNPKLTMNTLPFTSIVLGWWQKSQRLRIWAEEICVVVFCLFVFCNLGMYVHVSVDFQWEQCRVVSFAFSIGNLLFVHSEPCELCSECLKKQCNLL